LGLHSSLLFPTDDASGRGSTRVESSTTTGRDVRRRGSAFGPAARVRTGGHPPPRLPMGGGATRCVTPRQTCPRPNGFGRNLRSKTRWFTGFCNSHQVSHFATFFIDARAEISVAESRSGITTDVRSSPSHRVRAWGGGRTFQFSLAHSAPEFVRPAGSGAEARPVRGWDGVRRPDSVKHVFAVCSCRFRQ
jgi:hypothetical protein